MDEGRRKWVAFAPAIGAVVVIGVLIFVMRDKDQVAIPDNATASPSSTVSASANPTVLAASNSSPPTNGSVASPTSAASPAYSADDPPVPGKPIAPPWSTVEGPPPEVTPGKKWTDAEKIERATNSIKTIELRETVLEKEIADLEKSGNSKEAAEKRIILTRLRSHKTEILTKLDAGKAP